MSERSKLTSSHLRRAAFVYVRQSSQTQLERNVESTDRQYALVQCAIELGFAREQVVVIDEDLGISGSGMSDRSGFARLAAEVALGHAGLVLGLEVSRLARNNVDWYRLLDLCGVTDTVIGDADGLYHRSREYVSVDDVVPDIQLDGRVGVGAGNDEVVADQRRAERY